MDFNIAIILIGCVIIIVTLVLLLKEDNKVDDDLTSQIMMGINSYNKDHQQNDNYSDILDTIEMLSNEISDIREDIQKLTNSITSKDDHEEVGVSNNENWENFSQSLNYNMFIKKNDDIINLFNNGKSPDEIAKALNKSVREVEMVIKLIK